MCPSGYILLRKDRAGTHNGGEVAIICRSDWQIKCLFASDSFECVWSVLTTSNSKYYVAAIYHPPDPVYTGGEFLDYLSDCCEQVLSSDPDARIVIAGDINQLDINTLTSQHNFQQLVKSFTRGQKILDVFLTNCPHLRNQTSAFKSLVRSDHLSILFIPRIVVKSVRKTVFFRDVREHRKLRMDKKMDQFDWERFIISDDPSDNVRRLSDTLFLMFNECFPIIKDPEIRLICLLLLNFCVKSGKRSHGVIDSLKTMSCKSELNQIRAVNDRTSYHTSSRRWWNTQYDRR